jgi:hypothetical protein
MGSASSDADLAVSLLLAGRCQKRVIGSIEVRTPAGVLVHRVPAAVPFKG